jgi:tetratricopeptide (TPR) repeat protein
MLEKTRQRKKQQVPNKGVGFNPLSKRCIFCSVGVCLLLVAYILVVEFVNHRTSRFIRERNLFAAKQCNSVLRSISLSNHNSLLHEARIHRLEGEFIAFNNTANRILEAGGQEAQVQFEQTLGMAQQGYLDGVEDTIVGLLTRSDVDQFEVCDAYVNGLLASGRTGTAETVIGAWKKDHSNSAIPIYRLARVRESQQSITEAKELYREANRLNPRYFPATYALGRLHLDENEPNEALGCFWRCMSMPNPLAAKIGYAMALAKLGSMDQATLEFESVFNSETESIVLSYRSLGEAYERHVAASEFGKLLVSESKFDRALVVLNQALEFNVRDVSSRYSRALALRGLNRIEEADEESKRVKATEEALRDVNELRNLINREPSNVEAMVKLARILIEHESERNGLYWLRNALVANSESALVHSELARFYKSHANQAIHFSKLGQQHADIASRLSALKQ